MIHQISVNCVGLNCFPDIFLHLETIGHFSKNDLILKMYSRNSIKIYVRIKVLLVSYCYKKCRTILFKSMAVNHKEKYQPVCKINKGKKKEKKRSGQETGLKEKS